MSTAKNCRHQLHSLLLTWLLNPPAEYNIDIVADNIKRYGTAPPTESENPNHCILYTISTTAVPFTIDNNSEQHTLFGIKLATRIGDDEASREAAEDWLDDAEELLTMRLLEAEDPMWSEITIEGVRRDADRATWGIFRTSDIIFKMERN